MNPRTLLMAASGGGPDWPDIDGAAYDSVSLDPGLLINSFTFGSNGTRLYLANDADNDIVEYSLSSAYDLNTATFSRSQSINEYLGGDFSFYAVRFSTDGTRMYILDRDADLLHQFSMQSAWGLIDGWVQSFALSGVGATDCWFSTSGDILFVLDNWDMRVEVYTMTTNWDISTATLTRNVDVSTQSSTTEALWGLAFNEDGTKMFLAGSSTSLLADGVYQFSLANPWDTTSVTYDSVFFNPVESGSTEAVAFNPLGTKMYLMDFNGGPGVIYQYSL